MPVFVSVFVFVLVPVSVSAPCFSLPACVHVRRTWIHSRSSALPLYCAQPTNIKVTFDGDAVDASRLILPDGTERAAVFPLPATLIDNDDAVTFLGARFDPIEGVAESIRGAVRAVYIGNVSWPQPLQRCLAACKQGVDVQLSAGSGIAVTRSSVSESVTSLVFSGTASIQDYTDAIKVR